MNPINSSSSKSTCVTTSSNCIVWEGSDIPCIELCNGDSISEVTYKLATAFCEFKDSLDFSDFDLKCIFEACEACPEPEKSLTNILTLLVDKVCALEELIEDLNPTNVIEAEPFNVNLKCLAVIDGSGNVLNDDSQDEQIQAIIDEVCDHADDIELLQNQVEDHEDRITALENDTGEDIPQVSSDCLFVGDKDIDEAFELLDGNYCTFKESVGEPEDIASAIGQQCDLPALVGNPAFIVSPVNLAESFNNLWLAYCNLLTRVSLIETTCCKPTCDDIKIGFSTTFDQGASTVTLGFNAGTGTSIPDGWTDCGSILTITDPAGNSITVMLTIVNNYTSPEIDLSSFTKGSLLTFTLDLKMCNGEAECQKCIVKTVQYLNTECCTITNSGTADVLIVYTVPLNPAT